MSEHGDAYRGARARLTALAREIGDDGLATPVPTCPGWRVKDVYGHLVGLVSDVADRNTANAGSDEWTAAQVEARRDRTGEELLAEWDEKGPGLEALLDKLKPESASGITGDIAAHEADIYGALGRTDARDSDVVRLALERYVAALGDRITKAGLPALRVNDVVVGEGDPAATVRAPDFELFRALTGRRSPDQVAAFDWIGDPSPYLGIFSAYGVAASPVIE